MKRRISRAIVSSMTDRRIDGGLLARRAIKNALSIVRKLYGKRKLRGGVIHGKENVDWQNRVVNQIGLTAFGVPADDDELRNSRNENLENELKELTMKTDNRLRA